LDEYHQTFPTTTTTAISNNEFKDDAAHGRKTVLNLMDCFRETAIRDDPNELTEIECVKDDWLIINSIKAKDNQISSLKRNGGLILLSVACAVLSQSRGSFQLEINVRVFYTSCLYKMIVDSSQEHCWGRVSLAKDISDSRVESCIIRFISPVVRQQQRRSIVVCPPSDIELILLSCLPSFSLSPWRSLSLLAIAQAPSFPSVPPQVAPDSCWRLSVRLSVRMQKSISAGEKQNKMVDGLETKNIKGRQMRPLLLVRGESVLCAVACLHFSFHSELTTGDVCPLWRY
jgi:hypothetical protein